MLRLKSLLNYKFGLLSAAVLLFFGFIAGNYWFGNIHAARPMPELVELRNHNAELELALSKSQLALEIEQSTIAEMNNTLLQQQSEVVEQQLALRFYQKVMAPGDTANGVRIEDVTLNAGISVGHYRFELLIAQLEKRKRYIRGETELLVIGSENGQPTTISLKKLLFGDQNLKFSFRFFQSFNGEFTLPINFIPEQLQVTLKMAKRRGQKTAKITELFLWQDILIIPLKPLTSTTQSTYSQ
ncbi:MAG: hypothetical protein HRU22_00385 [Gammaproteobacteria bacterium]|nr:hypothetical protein [Gammaproteobacteria bacterium]